MSSQTSFKSASEICAAAEQATSVLKKNKYAWIGERRSDKEGHYYRSVVAVRKEGSFILNTFDTVQLLSPREAVPFVGTVLRLYEENHRKILDVEWFFLKDEILNLLPKEERNRKIEEREVFLAQGEVEIVANYMGSVKNPCYIVYLTEADAMIRENQKAMNQKQFFQLYFCRCSFDESERKLYPIAGKWTENKYLLRIWSTIPEEIRHFLQHETTLACFKHPPKFDPKQAIRIQQAILAAFGINGNSVPKDRERDKELEKKEKENDKDKSRRKSHLDTRGENRNDAAPGTNTSTNFANINSNSSVTGKSGAERRRESASWAPQVVAAPALTPEQILQMDEYDLAQRLMFDDLEFSSSDNQSSSSDEERARKPLRGVVRSKGRSSAQKREQYRTDEEFILHKWTDLSESHRKSFFLQARNLKDSYLSGTAPNATSASSSSETRPTLTKASSPEPKSFHTGANAVDTSVGSVGAGASVAENTIEDFGDINPEEYLALREYMDRPDIRDEDLSYKLFCYEEDLYASSSSSDGDSDSTNNKGRDGKPRIPSEKTAEQLAERAKKKAAKNFHAWTDLTFKRIKAYTKRAQKLRRYHAFHGPQPVLTKSPETFHKEKNELESIEVMEEDRDIGASILEAVRAGLGKMEIGLQLFARDMDIDTSSGSEEVIVRGHKSDVKNSHESTQGRKNNSFLSEVERVMAAFSSISSHKQARYMSRASKLIERYGPEDKDTGSRPWLARPSRLQNPKSPGAKRSAKRSVTTAVIAAPADSSDDGKRSFSSHRKRKASEHELLDQGEIAPLTRRNASESRSRYEEVRLKREIAANPSTNSRSKPKQWRSKAHTGSSRDGSDSSGTEAQMVLSPSKKTAAWKETKKKPKSIASSVKSEDQENDDDDDSACGSDDDVESQSKVESKINWRVAKKIRQDAMKESYRRRSEKLRATLDRKKEQTAATSVPQPVHALIPVFPLAGGDNNSDMDMSLESDDDRVSGRASQSATKQTGVKRNQTEVNAASTGRNRKRRSDQSTSQRRLSSRGGPSSRRRGQDIDAESDLEELTDNEEIAVKASDRKSSNQKSRTTITTTTVVVETTRRRAGANKKEAESGSELPSVGSRSVDSASENSVESGDETTMRQETGYSTRGRARQNSISGKNFMSQAPTHMGQRVGDQHQVAIPTYLGPCNQSMPVVNPSSSSLYSDAVRSGKGSMADFSARNRKEREDRELSTDETPALWLPVAPLATVTMKEDGEKDIQARLKVEIQLEEFLTRAEAVVKELKADKLRRYHEAEAKLKKQGSLLLAQQQRFNGNGIAQLANSVDPVSSGSGKIPVDATDNSFVLLAGEARIVMHQLFMDSGFDVERALDALPGKLASYLVLWTSSEQQRIGHAFERKVLYASVPSKSKSDAWEYTLRFLASAEELEENTTYTNADGADCIIPAVHSTGYLHQSTAASTTSLMLAGEDPAVSEANKFIERLSASVDETSFWQLLLSLSSVIKSGEFSPAQMVVKAHYILSMATYDNGQSYTRRLMSSRNFNEAENPAILNVPQVTPEDPVLGVSRENSLEKAGNNLSDMTSESVEFFTHSRHVNPATGAGTASSNPKTVVVPAIMKCIEQDEESSDGTSNNSCSDNAGATEVVVELFTSKDEAISHFNMFLPVLVNQ